jgi:adenylate cyclase
VSAVPEIRRLTVADVAAQSGADMDYVERLLACGILTVGEDGLFSATDARRVGIVHSLTEGGLPLDGLAESIRRGDIDLGFIDDPAYDRFAGLTDTTFRQLSERSGIPMDVALAIRQATGSALPEPDDRVRENELDVVPALELMIRHGVRPAVIERALRSYGDSLRRIAEIEADWWMTDVIAPILAGGGLAASVGPMTTEFSRNLGPLTDRLLMAVYHGQQAHAWMKNIFEGFEVALARAGLHRPIEHPPAMCFLDLAGYTRLTEERGDEAAAELAGRLSRLVQRTSARHGGKPVKWLGDGVMFHFREAGPGVVAALEMVEGAREANLPPAHVGLHAGPVLFQEGDYFGRTVNIASRIADYARQGEVLVSDDVVAEAAETVGVQFEPIGAVELKGMTEAVSLHVARRAP